MSVLYIQEHPTAPSRNRIFLQCDEKHSKCCMNAWSTRHIAYNQAKTTHSCRNCIRSMNASKAGKIGGRKAVETGQIKQFIAAAATPESRQKARETMRKKGKGAFTSKVEEAVYNELCQKFGVDDIKRWVYIKRNGNNHCVDLHVISIDTYLEVDGVYWHGLDRPYKELHDKTRLKFDRDRLLDAYCENNGIRLIRCTDIDVNTYGTQHIIAKLV